MTAQPILLLREDQIPLGTQVQIVQEGTTNPMVDDNGPLPPLTCMVGGVPLRRKLYELSSMREHTQELPDGTKVTSMVMAGGMEGFKLEVRFRPMEVFTVEDAPTDRKFAVFVGGEWITYKQLPTPQPYDELVEVMRQEDGRLISTCGVAYRIYRQPIELPPHALLVTMSTKKP